MPKILILVLSYNSPPFDVLMKTQQQTFDSIEVEGVETMYYHGGFDPENILTEKYYGMIAGGASWSQRAFKCTDKYYYMSAKFKKALEWAKDDEYDYIFRTNSSSYVNKKALVEFSKTLPTEKLYAGWTFVDSEDFGGACVSGAGIWLSRDTANILMEEIDPIKEIEEDVYCGRILRKHGIEAIDDKSRYDVNEFHDYIPTDRYHYRHKGITGNRLVDAHNMIMLHKMIINKNI
jgi:hypothetical protein